MKHLEYFLTAVVFIIISYAKIINAKGVGSIQMPKKTKLLNIRIDAELKRSAKKNAVEDGRSLSNWVTRLIEREVKKANSK